MHADYLVNSTFEFVHCSVNKLTAVVYAVVYWFNFRLLIFQRFIFIFVKVTSIPQFDVRMLQVDL